MAFSGRSNQWMPPLYLSYIIQEQLQNLGGVLMQETAIQISDRIQFETMAHQFEPLQNDLILRTAWGKICFLPSPGENSINCYRAESRKTSNVGDAPRYQ